MANPSLVEDEAIDYAAVKQERWDKVLEEFKPKKDEYPEFWQPKYNFCKRRRQFVLNGKQFDNGVASTYGFTIAKEPNLLLTYVNQMANETLQNDYSANVSPNGGGATLEKARERQDVLRGLQRTGGAPQVYNFASRDQISSGLAYSMIQMKYAGRRGLGKTFKYKYYRDTFNVFPTPSVEECTFSDATDWLIKKKVKKRYWKKETGLDTDDWGSDKERTLWEYWVKQIDEDQEYLRTDGKEVLESELPLMNDDSPDLTDINLDEEGQPLGRGIEEVTWCWYKITDDEKVIDEQTWKGEKSPIVATTGRRVEDEKGEIQLQAATYFAEEPQLIYSIIENIMMLRLARSPYSRYKVAYESVLTKGEADLKEISLTGEGTLWYKQWNTEGKEIRSPEEIQPELVDAMLLKLQEAQVVKMQQILGIFDAQLGQRSNETSGVAIERRNQQGLTGNYDITFNYLEYVKELNAVVLEVFPKYMTAPQQLMFVDSDDKAVIKWVNQNTKDGYIDFKDDGEYDLVIEVRPNAKTAREEEADSLMNLLKVAPVLATNPKVLSVVVKAQPGRYAQQIGEILDGKDEQSQREQQAQKAIQTLQGHLQTIMQQAQQKQQQDAQTIQMLKQSIGMLKQQMGLMKQQHDLENQGQEMGQQYQDMEAQCNAMELRLKELDTQTKQYTAESGRMDAETNRLKAVGDLMAPEPATPKPGEALPV